MRETPASRNPVGAVLLALVRSAAACSGEGTLSPFLNARVGADALAGNWVLHVPASSNCSPMLQAFDLRLDLERTWVAGVDTDGDREFLAGRWRAVAGDTTDYSLQGRIEPDRRAAFTCFSGGACT